MPGVHIHQPVDLHQIQKVKCAVVSIFKRVSIIMVFRKDQIM